MYDQGLGKLAGMPIQDLADVRDVPFLRAVKPKIAEIKKVVSRFYDVSIEDMDGECRKRVFAFPRQIAASLAREMTGCSYPVIARHFGDRNHVTILLAHRKINKLEQRDTVLAGELAALRKGIAEAVSARAA